MEKIKPEQNGAWTEEQKKFSLLCLTSQSEEGKNFNLANAWMGVFHPLNGYANVIKFDSF